MSRAWTARIRKGLRPALAVLVALAAALAAAATFQVASLLYLLYIGASLTLGVVAATTLTWMLHAWRTPESLAESRLEDDGRPCAQSFSLILPARHEEAVLEATLARLATCEHPDFEVIAVVGSDDHATRAVAERMAERIPERIKVVIDSSWPKSKPKALNAALPYCTGTVTGVFDAEDDVHPALLQRVDQCFQRTDADVVQAGVQLMNFRSSWLTVHNVLEYYFWFRSRLHLHARQRFIPLGGNTVFIRTAVLRAVRGWDPDCLAEDCELGVRLSAAGARTAVFYEPDLVTREECPPTLGAFVRQRTRWNQGYLQTLSRGYWRRLPLRQRALGGYILAMPFVLAIAWLLVPVAIATAVTLKVPVPITLTSFLPLLPLLGMLVVEVAGLGEFCRVYRERASLRDYARLVVGLPFYQVVLSFAAARSVAREARGIRGWEKTAHLGLHLAEPPAAESGSAGRILADGAAAGAVTGGQRALGAGAADGHDAPQPARRGPQRLRWLPQDGAESRELEPSLAASASAGAVAGAEQGAEPDSDALAASTVPSPAENFRQGGTAGARAPGRGAWAFNGHGQWRASHPDGLLDGADGEPLWKRLRGAPLASRGSAVLTPPPPAMPPVGGVIPAGRRRDRTLTRFARPSIDLVVQILLVVGLGSVEATNMLHWPAVLFDEGTYVGNAWAAGNRGELAFYTYTYGHPPLGWLLFTLWVKVGGFFGHVTYSLDAGREYTCAVVVVCFLLLYMLARRIGMSPVFAALSVILFALSPLALYFHRGMELDNPDTLWAIAAFVLALSPRRRLWSYAASGACFAISVLSKETALIMLPALLLAVIQNSDRRTRRYCWAVFLSFFLLIGSFFPLYATLKGELLPGPGHVSLVGTDINMLFTRKATGNIFNPHTVAHGTVMFWLTLDPWLPWAGLLLSPIALALRSSRAIALALLIQVAMMLRTGYLPNMYVIAQLPFDALIVAGTMQALWRFALNGILRRNSREGAAGRRKILWIVNPLKRLAAAGSALAFIAASYVAVFHVAPAWAKADQAAMTLNLTAPRLAAEQWMLKHVGRKQRIIVTDAFWVYLIDHDFDSQRVKGGFNSPTVVSYWPLDKDPAVRRFFPYSWREFTYVLSTPAIRATETQTPSTFQAIHHSRIAASFGVGPARIEIREIIPTPAPIGREASGKSLAYKVPTYGAVPSLERVAHMLHVTTANLTADTNRHADEPIWWYYEGRHRFGDPLPRGITLYYARR